MKLDSILMMGAAVAAVATIAYLTRARASGTSSTLGTSGTAQSLNNNSNVYGVNEILNPALPGQTGYGWRYFSDGTTIDPQGNYFKDGQQVWKAIA